MCKVADKLSMPDAALQAAPGVRDSVLLNVMKSIMSKGGSVCSRKIGFDIFIEAVCQDLARYLPQNFDDFLDRLLELRQSGHEHILYKHNGLAGIAKLEITKNVFWVLRAWLFMKLVADVGENLCAVQEILPTLYPRKMYAVKSSCLK